MRAAVHLLAAPVINGATIRVLLDQAISLVEAAHLIPFGVSRND
jgi:hypothetical protein